MDVFTWSLPFVAEKVLEILYNILMKGAKTYGMETKDVEEDKDFSIEAISQLTKQLLQTNKRCNYNLLNLFHVLVRADVVKQKLFFVGKMMKMHANLRENRELFLLLKGMCPD